MIRAEKVYPRSAFRIDAETEYGVAVPL